MMFHVRFSHSSSIPSMRRSARISRRIPISLPTRLRAHGSSLLIATWARSIATWGRWFPRSVSLWQDPVPAAEGELIGDAEIATLKAKILASGLTNLAARLSRMGCGGFLPRFGQARRRYGARIRLEPQKNWRSTSLSSSQRCSARLRGFRRSSMRGGKEGLACGSHYSRWQMPLWKRGPAKKAGLTTSRFPSRRVAPTLRRSRRMWRRSLRLSRRQTASATICGLGIRSTPRLCWVDRAQLLTLSCS